MIGLTNGRDLSKILEIPLVESSVAEVRGSNAVAR